MNDRRPSRRISRRKARDMLASPVNIGDRPALAVGIDRHPVGPQRIKLIRLAIAARHHLDIAIAMQQQMRRDRFEQRLPRADRLDQPYNRFFRRHQRRAAHSFGDNTHRPLGNRIFDIGLAHPPLIRKGRVPRKSRATVCADIAAPQGRPTCSTPALEGERDIFPECHLSSSLQTCAPHSMRSSCGGQPMPERSPYVMLLLECPCEVRGPSPAL